MNDEDLMNIVNEIFEEIEVDDIIEEMGDESDEDHTFSDDSDCISDCSDNLTKINKKIIDNSQINALNTKQCAIYFYYSTGDALAVVRHAWLVWQIGQMYAIRKHVTEHHDAIGSFCSSCKNPLFLILPCNMCLICTQ